MQYKSKYITEEDYKQMFGLDLSANMKATDNPSDMVNAFLYRIETQVATAIDSKFCRQVDREYPTFSNYQKEHYKLALLYQVDYVLRNGDISNDSGYDTEAGKVADRNYLTSISLSNNTIEHLRLCGLWTTHIKANSRGGINDWWMY